MSESSPEITLPEQIFELQKKWASKAFLGHATDMNVHPTYEIRSPKASLLGIMEFESISHDNEKLLRTNPP